MAVMRILVDIDLLDDEQMQSQIAMDSLWIMLLGILFGVFAAAVLPHEDISVVWFVLLGAASVAALPIHELVHAIAFKVFSGGRAHVKFGFSGWMLYTTSPGTVLVRKSFCAVLLAPAIIVSAVMGVVAFMQGYPLLAWFLVVVHLAGCTGDIGYVRIILSEPMANLVQDTSKGIALYHDE